MSPATRAIALIAAFGLWTLAFVVKVRRAGDRPKTPARIDPRARWGILLEAVGFFLIYTHGPRTWAAAIPMWRAWLGALAALSAIALAWSSIGHLGRQWRFDAGLNADHELVQTGAYRIVRHPIYASMFCMLLVAVAWVGTFPGWPIGVAAFIAGTEVRVRIEDALLRERFGERFTAWQKRVPAYVPFVR